MSESGIKGLAPVKKVFSDSFWEGLRPDPILTVSQWADRYRVLSSKASSEAGRWNTKRTPYLRQIMDDLSVTSLVEEVVFMKGAQVGGTEAGNNWIGYIIDYAPAPTMAVSPTIDMAKRNSKQRIQPLIDDSPRLSKRVKSSREKDSGNTILEKDFPGGRLVLTGANSGTGLRSMPAKNAFLDEKDAWPGDVSGEGSPSALVRARTRTFSRRKLFHVSTPTFAGRSQIESDYEGSDQRRYFIPCPECGHMQTLRWANIIYTVSKNASGQDEATDVYYKCEENSCRIEEYKKNWFMAEENGAKWIAKYPGVKRGKVAGYHLNSLYSPLGWFSWQETAQQWLNALGKPEEQRGFINTILGETWKEKGDAPEWQRLYDRREEYEIGSVDDATVFITAGVDVQKDRVEVEVVGWDREKRSRSIEFLVYPGDTATETPWRELDRLLMKVYRKTAGHELPIRMLAVDSGYNTQHVYNWVRKHPLNKVMAIKGVDNASLLLGQPTAVDINLGGKRIRRGLKLWPVGIGIAKSELYSWLRLERPTDEATLKGETYPRGYCHFPQYGEEYFKQMTAEQLVVKIVRGHKHYEWEKVRDRNEALDCRVYARAAAAAVGLDRYSSAQWDDLASQVGAPQETAPVPEKVQENPVNNPVNPVKDAVETPPIRRKMGFKLG